MPSRYVIDLNCCGDLLAAKKFGYAFQHVQSNVLPTMKANAEKEKQDTGKETGPRQSHFQRWWKHWRGRPEMLTRLSTIPRYIACARVTKRPIFEFVDSTIHPNDALQISVRACRQRSKMRPRLSPPIALARANCRFLTRKAHQLSRSDRSTSAPFRQSATR